MSSWFQWLTLSRYKVSPCCRCYRYNIRCTAFYRLLGCRCICRIRGIRAATRTLFRRARNLGIDRLGGRLGRCGLIYSGKCLENEKQIMTEMVFLMFLMFFDIFLVSWIIFCLFEKRTLNMKLQQNLITIKAFQSRGKKCSTKCLLVSFIFHNNTNRKRTCRNRTLSFFSKPYYTWHFEIKSYLPKSAGKLKAEKPPLSLFQNYQIFWIRTVSWLENFHTKLIKN